MMKRNKTRESVPVEALTWKQVMKHEGEPVLTLTLRWPALPDDCPALRRMGRYYQHVSHRWRKRWETALYTLACAALADLRARSLPFTPWEAALDFTVTYNEQGLLSLYMDAYEFTGGAHGSTVRCGDTWNLQTGYPCALPFFFPPKSHWRRLSIAAVRAQIAAQLATGEYMYLDGWEEAAAREFDPCRFYLTAEGVVVFYPLYALAPYVEGFPTFLIVKWPTP